MALTECEQNLPRKEQMANRVTVKDAATEGTMFFPPLFYISLTDKMEYVSSLSSQNGLEEIGSWIQG